MIVDNNIPGSLRGYKSSVVALSWFGIAGTFSVANQHVRGYMKENTENYPGRVDKKEITTREPKTITCNTLMSFKSTVNMLVDPIQCGLPFPRPVAAGPEAQQPTPLFPPCCREPRPVLDSHTGMREYI